MKEGFYEKIITQGLQREIEALNGYLMQRKPFGKTDGPFRYFAHTCEFDLAERAGMFSPSTTHAT